MAAFNAARLPLANDRRVALVELADPKQREGGWFESA
jgi:hypothetical protein